jgi:hypothetical protein
VQAAYAGVICAMADHYPEALPASRYIETGILLMMQGVTMTMTQAMAPASRATLIGELQQVLRILGGSCHLAAADAAGAIAVTIVGLKQSGRQGGLLSAAACPRPCGTC